MRTLVGSDFPPVHPKRAVSGVQSCHIPNISRARGCRTGSHASLLFLSLPNPHKFSSLSKSEPPWRYNGVSSGYRWIGAKICWSPLISSGGYVQVRDSVPVFRCLSISRCTYSIVLVRFQEHDMFTRIPFTRRFFPHSRHHQFRQAPSKCAYILYIMM